MLVQNLISSVRFQLKALEETLEILENQLNAHNVEQEVPQAAACPECGSTALNDAPTMGRPSQKACRDCNFVGEVH